MQSSSRNGAKVRLLAVHTTEGIKRVGDLVAFFNRPTAAGSSHAAADSTGACWGPAQGYVPYDRAAWTLRNGNPVSDNLEYCGWAKTTREQWLTAEAQGLEAIARWLADRSKARGIPLVKLSPADVKAGKSGVIGHVDWTQGMNDGTHWDPGPGFPWDVVINRARQIANPPPTEEDDMPLNSEDFRKLTGLLEDKIINRDVGRKPDGSVIHTWEAWRDAALLMAAVAEIKADVDAIKARLDADASTP